jgi:glycosyltransferase involved in cell wall biosynthesis
MKIQILISQYDKETQDVIKPLLDSIALQRNVDLANEVGVIIVNDGSKTVLDTEWLKTYPYHIQYIITEHGGVGHARNAGLDAATADYVMFCDADDLFMNVCGLWLFMSEVQRGEFDILTSLFVEEVRIGDDRHPQFINHENDSTFIHGKIVRRQYLIDKNIRWNESLECHGDSYFNCLAINLADDMRYLSTPFYLWAWRQESVCRSDPKYMLRTYNDFLNSSQSLVREFLNRDRRDKAEFFGVNTIFENYYTLMRPAWLKEENVLYRAATMLKCREFWFEFKELLTTIPTDVLHQIQINTRKKYFDECGVMEQYTFAEWVKYLEEL